MSKKKRQRQDRASTRRKQPSAMTIPVIVGVVVVAVIIGAILSIESGRSTPSASAGELTQGSTVGPLDTRSLPYPDVPRIALDDTQELLGQGQAILVDVRSKESFDKAHAAGAISMPEEEIAARLNELPRDKELILYCTWGQEQQSARVAQTLISNGLSNVKALLGGFAAWQQAGLPVEQAGP